jgi:hypothetical protein
VKKEVFTKVFVKIREQNFCLNTTADSRRCKAEGVLRSTHVKLPPVETRTDTLEYKFLKSQTEEDGEIIFLKANCLLRTRSFISKFPIPTWGTAK